MNTGQDIRILFTGVGRRVELLQAFRLAALCLGKNLTIYGADMSGDAPALAYCDYRRRTCGMRDARYIEELLAICEKDRIDLLIPTIDTDLLVLSESREKFRPAGTRVLVSGPDMVRICRDKNLTSQFFADCGLSAPVPVHDYKMYTGGFPAFIKPKDGSSSINAYKVNYAEELEYYASRIEDYIVQPFISGEEYTIDIFCDFEGRPVSIVPRRRLQVRAGEVLKTRIVMDRRMIDESKRLVSQFRPCGAMAVQLIREEGSGVDYFIEINPRFGGGAPLSMKAGARSAETVLKLLSGEAVPYAERVDDGAVYSRFDQSVCIGGGMCRRREIKGIIFDLDDTLFSEKEYVKSGYQSIAEYVGREDAAEKLWEYFEAGLPAVDRYLEGIGHPEWKEGCLKAYREHKPDIQLDAEAREVIQELQRRGILVGIITDGRPEGQRNKLEALGLGQMIKDIIITDELGGEAFRKPCDIAFRIMQRRWRIPYEEIAYVGDNGKKDFQAPGQLGMQGIWFKNKEGLYREQPEIQVPVITKLREIWDLIR